MRSFASDNNAGIHPRIMDAILECNQGHTIGYGDDIYTKQAISEFKNIFNESAEVYFVYGGTGANVLGLKAMTNAFNSIICAETAHIYVDECNAPEKFTGCKLQTVATQNGKITPEQIRPLLHGFDFEHHAQPGVISISQPTELGTVFDIDELLELKKLCLEYGLLFHMDGARISNAAAALNCSFGNMTQECGVDVLSFGGTKNGMMFGEAIVFFNKKLARNFKYLRKQGMQLHSKMRYISAQFNAFLRADLWKVNALHANTMARKLEKELKKLPDIKFTQRVETNGIFAIVPKSIIKPLQDVFFFYIWNEDKNEVRWMTSWDTTEDDIESFISTIRKILK